MSPDSASPVHSCVACPNDVLVVATGGVFVPEETEGLTGPGWRLLLNLGPNVVAIPRYFFPFPASGSSTNRESGLSS
jgi:hypothetical protein